MNRILYREIQPEGWLKRQLGIQAQGLAGNLDQIWPDVRDSAWIGGDREGWERVPYWLDGFIPLAYLLRDQGMIARAGHYIDQIHLALSSITSCHNTYTFRFLFAFQCCFP